MTTDDDTMAAVLQDGERVGLRFHRQLAEAR